MKFMLKLVSAWAIVVTAILAFTVYLVKNNYVLEYRDASYICERIK